MSNPQLYVLVGVPGSGKSTWVKWAKTQPEFSNAVVVSTDHYVERYAKRSGKTYSEVFNEVMPIAVELMTRAVIRARKAGKDIIWDQTSTSIGSRKKKLHMLPNYYKIAVVFETPEPQELQARLDSRPGKTIPREVLNNMIRQFEVPTFEEGFQKIWLV